MRENESKRSRLGHGTLMVPVKQGKKSFFFLLELYDHSGAVQADVGEQRRHTALLTHKRLL